MRMSHIGIRVSDWARSLRFYHDALGFRFVGEDRLGAESAAPLFGAASPVRVGWLEREGVRIQLLELPAAGPAPGGARESALPGSAPSPFDRFGPTHLALRVADLDAVLRELGAQGVPVLEQTRSARPELRARSVFVTDPDGAWIELAEQPGD